LTNESERLAPSVTVDLSLYRGLFGRALFFFSAPLHHSRSYFHICRAPRHSKARRRTPTRICWLDIRDHWLAFVSTRDWDRDLYLNCVLAPRGTPPIPSSLCVGV